jgi:hypothetical protein
MGSRYGSESCAYGVSSKIANATTARTVKTKAKTMMTQSVPMCASFAGRLKEWWALVVGVDADHPSV